MTQYSIKLKNSLNRFKNPLFRILGFSVILFVVLLSFQRCANIQKPTGGPKDSLPPKIVGEIPKNFTTNFKEEKITITFDEFVKTTNPAKEFSVSPDLDESPVYKVRRKNLVIELPDSLEENTTYTINLGKGLVDFNESNPILNYTYVFSTGPELDSLSISGKVTNGFTKKFDKEKDKDINVILIPVARDSIFGKKKASIFTTVDTSGIFKLQNLKEDTYQIYALKEQNNDRIYNGTEEWIGFLLDSIVLNGDITGIHLELSKGPAKDFRSLEKKLNKDGTASISFTRPLENPSIRVLDNDPVNDSIIPVFANTMDSVKIYLPNFDFDSIKFELSDNQQILDTSLIRKPRNLKIERPITPKYNITNKVDRVKHITVTSSRPIKTIDKNKIILTEDTVPVRNFNFKEIP